MRAGIDEAGRGPLLGPMVVAGVAIEDDAPLRALGVKDSKKLTAPRREKLAEEIRKVAAQTAMVVISASEIDDGREDDTLNGIEVGAFAAVARKLGASEYYLDAADVSAERFGRLVLRRLRRSPPPRIISQHKADVNFPVVSAASILAKVERDRLMAALASRLERVVAMPVGSGYPSDPETMAFVRAYVDQTGEMPPEARRSWKPARLILAQSRMRPLTTF